MTDSDLQAYEVHLLLLEGKMTLEEAVEALLVTVSVLQRKVEWFMSEMPEAQQLQAEADEAAADAAQWAEPYDWDDEFVKCSTCEGTGETLDGLDCVFCSGTGDARL